MLPRACYKVNTHSICGSIVVLGMRNLELFSTLAGPICPLQCLGKRLLKV